MCGKGGGSSSFTGSFRSQLKSKKSTKERPVEATKRPHAGLLVVKQRVVAPLLPPLMSRHSAQIVAVEKREGGGGRIFEEIIDLPSSSPSCGSDGPPLPLALPTGLFAAASRNQEAVRGDSQSDPDRCDQLFLLNTINRSG